MSQPLAVLTALAWLGAFIGALPAGAAAAAGQDGLDIPPVLNTLTGLVLIADPKDVVQSASPDQAGVTIKGLPLLERSVVKKELESFLGKPLTEAVRAKIIS